MQINPNIRCHQGPPRSHVNRKPRVLPGVTERGGPTSHQPQALHRTTFRSLRYDGQLATQRPMAIRPLDDECSKISGRLGHPVPAGYRGRPAEFWSGVTERVAAERTASSRPLVGFDTALILDAVVWSVIERVERVREPLASRQYRTPSGTDIDWLWAALPGGSNRQPTDLDASYRWVRLLARSNIGDGPEVCRWGDCAQSSYMVTRLRRRSSESPELRRPGRPSP